MGVTADKSEHNLLLNRSRGPAAEAPELNQTDHFTANLCKKTL